MKKTFWIRVSCHPLYYIRTNCNFHRVTLTNTKSTTIAAAKNCGCIPVFPRRWGDISVPWRWSSHCKTGVPWAPRLPDHTAALNWPSQHDKSRGKSIPYSSSRELCMVDLYCLKRILTHNVKSFHMIGISARMKELAYQLNIANISTEGSAVMLFLSLGNIAVKDST